MYFLQLIIPKNTAIATPIIENIIISPGILRSVRIVFPTGCADLVGVAIHYLSGRILPINDQGWFVGNGGQIEFTPDIVLDKAPFVLDVYGYNLDDTYQHKPTIGFEIEFSGSFAEKESKRVFNALIPVVTVGE